MKNSDRSGIQLLECGDCPQVYVGQTGRTFEECIKEHFSSFTNKNDNSNYAKHLNDEGHTFNDNYRILHVQNKAMCGDGANDCGALKAAHTGISLSEAESSVASPFTSKIPTITCVLSVIKEGRAALVTSFGIFKYMASYSLCQFASVLILYNLESNLTDIEFLYIDLCIISIFAFFFGRTPAYGGKLVKETPLNSLVSVSPVLSLLLQMLLVLVFQVAPFLHLQQLPDYVPFNATAKEGKDAVGCVENYTIFTVSSFQYIILAVVFSKGPPYRESILSNWGLLFSAMVLCAFSVYLALDPVPFLRDHFELVLPDTWDFRFCLLGYAATHAVLAVLVEAVVVEHCLFKKLRYRFHNVDASKRKFLAIERDLQRNARWPMLTSHVCTTASPTTPPPSSAAEFVVEREQFDKNHVLNSFYPSQLEENAEFQSAVQLVESDASSFRTADSLSSFSKAGCVSTPNTPFRSGEDANANIYRSALQNHVANGRIRSISQCESGDYTSFNGEVSELDGLKLELVEHRGQEVNLVLEMEEMSNGIEHMQKLSADDQSR